MVLLSNIIKDNALVSKETWQQYINSLHVPEENMDMETAAKRVHDVLETAILSRIPNEPFGVLLSGGVDSSIIATILKNNNINFSCFAIGTENAPDLAYAQQLAKELDVTLYIKHITAADVLNAVQQILQLLKENNTVKIEIGAAALLAVKLAKQHKINTLYSGLGAEEIFAGYKRHVLAKNINQECWRGLADDLWERDLTRDTIVAAETNTAFLTPFLDPLVIQEAMRISGDLKVQDQERKLVLRHAAILAGVPQNIAWRKKVAMQYGSRVGKQLKLIASVQGLQKRDYIQKSLNNQ